MSQYLKDKLESLMKRYNQEMEGAAKLEKSHKELGHYTDEHINQLVKEEKDKIKTKFITDAKSLLSEINKSRTDYHGLKLKSLYPLMAEQSNNSNGKLIGELQTSEGIKRALEFLSDPSELQYAQLINDLNNASSLGRTDFVSAAIEKLQPVFDQLSSEIKLTESQSQLVELRDNHFKSTGAAAQLEKIQSSNMIEEKIKIFLSEVWSGCEWIFVPDKDSKNGTENLLRAQLEDRLSSVPKDLLN